GLLQTLVTQISIVEVFDAFPFRLLSDVAPEPPLPTQITLPTSLDTDSAQSIAGPVPGLWLSSERIGIDLPHVTDHVRPQRTVGKGANWGRNDTDSREFASMRFERGYHVSIHIHPQQSLLLRAVPSLFLDVLNVLPEVL